MFNIWIFLYFTLFGITTFFSLIESRFSAKKTYLIQGVSSLFFLLLVAFLYNWGVVAFTRFSENSTLSTLILFFFKWGYILFPILTIINWTLTYFRLKESEVIHRI